VCKAIIGYHGHPTGQWYAISLLTNKQNDRWKFANLTPGWYTWNLLEISISCKRDIIFSCKSIPFGGKFIYHRQRTCLTIQRSQFNHSWLSTAVVLNQCDAALQNFWVWFCCNRNCTKLHLHPPNFDFTPPQKPVLLVNVIQVISLNIFFFLMNKKYIHEFTNTFFYK